MKKNKILWAIIILGVISFLTSLYLLENHYAPPTEGAFCDFGEAVSCSLVNTSIYSELLNVPVALFGALWSLILIFMSWRALRNDGFLITGIFLWNLVAIPFVGYFVWAEFVLRTICPFCTLVHVIVLITVVLSFVLYKSEGVKISDKKLSEKLKSLFYTIIIVYLAIILLFNLPQGKKENYDALAQCLTKQGVKMYSSFKCGVCAKTKEMFGGSFKYITEVECHPQSPINQFALCQEKGIKNTPTWIMEQDGKEIKRQAGFMSIDELREFSGCG
ncbi:hypothetical protein J4228_03885 [Candidatus Woesearchaeota archaeon]|nr:hypothetical protein [Candidatus Woesearchaeota archaeon]